MAALSVIIPVYQSEPYLRQCLDSICGQTLRDLEIICVNDGSTDGSLGILREYEGRDSRLRVVNQENMGPAIARNAGLELAAGEYIGFLDSDDYIDSDYFASMLRAATSHDADIVLNNNVLREEAGASRQYRGSYYQKQLPEGEFLDKYFAADCTVCLLYAHLYRASMIRRHSIRFQAHRFHHKDDYFHEDEYFHRLAHYHADKVFAYSGPEYHYVSRAGSIMATRGRKNLAYVRCFSALKDYFGDRIYDKSFKLRLFAPMLYSEISDAEEFAAVRDYLLSLRAYISRSSVFVSDFDRFAMDSVIASASVEECTAKLGKYPYFRYQTRIRMKARDHISVSVVIPVHNTEEYLPRCLESICSQTLRDIEIICVNDGSTDCSADVIRRYANEDARIRVVDLPRNKGVSNARNTGIDHAVGKYIYMMDSDDWVDKDHLSVLFQTMEAQGADVLTNSNYVMEYPDGRKPSLSSFPWVPEEGGLIDKKMIQRLFPPVLWANLYRRSFINDQAIRFMELKNGEDIDFTGRCYLLAERVCIFKGPYYHYFQRPDSLMRSKERGALYIESFRMMRDCLLDQGVDLTGVRLFFVESLFIENEQTFNFIKEYMAEIRQDFDRDAGIYSELDRFLMRIMSSTADYEAFEARYNPNISMSFIRSRITDKKL